MPRVDRGAATELLVSWLTDLSGGRLAARPVASRRADIEVTDTHSGRVRPLKLAVREISKSNRQGKNFQVREAVLRSAPEGIVVLLYLNEEGLRQKGQPIRAAWVLTYSEFLSQGLTVSSNGAYQCRPLPSPDGRDDWSVYRCFAERELVMRVASPCMSHASTGSAPQPAMGYVIRAMQPDDLDEVVDIITDHWEADGVAARRYYEEHFSVPPAPDKPAERNFVAQDACTGRILGVSGFGPDKYWTPGIWWLSWTYVRRDARRRGIGSALLAHVKTEVARCGGGKLFLDTSSDPSYADAVRLYERHGFRVEARLAEYYGKNEDFLILVTDLEGGDDEATTESGK
jgi:GNAT superfamily N-acetyltransferase